uniref:Transforming growth factor beta regulator 1 n=1 Tax=Timema tahoe TaxID=61484 RepID=A0A7R9FJ30_9NEOP|nr:unnamed protein product [Timema tahoe]
MSYLNALEDMNRQTDLYKKKISKLKRFAKDIIYVVSNLLTKTNEAVCLILAPQRMRCQIRMRTDLKWLVPRFDLIGSPLPNILSIADKFYVLNVFVEAECQPQAHTPKHNLGVSPPHNTGDGGAAAKKQAAKKKLTDGNEPVKSNSKPKKTSTPKAKKIVQPITLDMTGRPVFPIVLGGLTIHSLGEVVSDRPDYHTEELIFPVGFCSSRMYGSLKDPEKKCVYTCKILDGGYSPSFEIVADNELEYPLVGESASDCHTLLLHKINLSLGFEVVSTRGRGPEFFGFSHPTILNLIQSSPGTRKCTSYKWSRFEVSKTGEPPTEERDAALSYEALQRSIIFAKSHLLTAKKEEPQEQLMSNANTTLRDLLMS